MYKNIIFILSIFMSCVVAIDTHKFIFPSTPSPKVRKNKLLRGKIVAISGTTADSILPSSKIPQFLSEFTMANIEKLVDILKGTTPLGLADTPEFFADLIASGFKPDRAPNAEQVDVIKGVVSTPSKLIIVEGVPGAGKTSGVLKWVVGFVRGITPQTPVYTSAPNDGGMRAVNGDFKAENAAGHVRILDFTALINGENLADNAYVIIDECYMMNKEQLLTLLTTAQKKNWRILLTGDSLQNLPNKEETIFGLLEAFPQFHLTQSFRAKIAEERNFASVVQKAWSNSTTHNTAINKGLEYLLSIRENQLLKMGDMKSYIDEFRNIFASFTQNSEVPNTRIKAAANWVKATLDDGKTVMAIAHASDIALIKEELLRKGLDEAHVNQILKTSAESQGAAAAYVAVILNKKMTQSEIYVALSRHKEEVMVIVPVGTMPEHFSSLEDAISYPYVSDQQQIELLLKFQSAARKVGKMSALLSSVRKSPSSPAGLTAASPLVPVSPIK